MDGELLRLSLHKHLAARQLSTEAVLRVEYVPAVLPPTPKEEHPHEDWVSAVAGLGGGGSTGGSGDAITIASGCYDGVVRLWRGGEQAAAWAAHRGPVTAAACVPSRTGDGPMLLTAGQDCSVRLWRGVEAAAGGGAAPEPVALLKGHSDAVAGAAVAPDGALAATGGWDSRLLLWRCGDAALAAAAEEGGSDDEDAAAAQQKGGAKKRKVGANGAAAAQHVEAPRAELAGHSQCVAGLAWPAAGAAAGAVGGVGGRVQAGAACDGRCCLRRSRSQALDRARRRATAYTPPQPPTPASLACPPSARRHAGQLLLGPQRAGVGCGGGGGARGAASQQGVEGGIEIGLCLVRGWCCCYY